MQKNTTTVDETDFSVWKYPVLSKPDSDGAYCHAIQRRISCYVSYIFLKIGLTPTQATIIDFVFGCLAVLSILLHSYLAGIVFIALFGIWSCVDGEIARLSDECSQSGDFFDTMTDRVVEMSVIIAFYYSIYTLEGRISEHLSFAALTYMGGVYLLTVSSEKYRSAVCSSYPKKKVESFFSWVSSGSDIRLLWLSVAILIYYITGSQENVVIQIAVFSVIFFINFITRMFIIKNLLQTKTVTSQDNKPFEATLLCEETR